jgi:YHS domain-containing protein
MRITPDNLGIVSALAYTGCALALALVFFGLTLTGDYDWVARLGGAGWVFLLALVIFMPTLPGLIRERVTGEKAAPMVHDHDAMLRGESQPAPAAGRDHERMMGKGERRKTMAKDPVCGMDVDIDSAAGMSEHNGHIYHFCSLGCQQEFDGEPEKFTMEHGDEAEDL